MQRGAFFSATFLLFFLSAGFAQEKLNVKFGNVSPQDFATKIYSVDSNATAVVIADIGSSSIDGNNKGWFSLIYKKYRRVHILNKNGYDIANISISLYADGSAEETLDKVRAVTYNLEDGKVVETRLDPKSGVFKDKIDKNHVIKKFTLPNVKEGSIIEYEYTIVSDFLNNLRPWEFQGAYPRLWSEYNLTLPSFFNYVFLEQGYLKYDIRDSKDGRMSYNVTVSEGTGPSERVSLDANITDFRWVVKNAPSMKEENYTSTTDNYIKKIEFQLSELRQPLQYRRIMSTWPQLSEQLLESEYFGQQLSKDNPWMNEITDPLIKGAADNLEKARRVFAWVRDNITCTSHRGIDLDQALRNISKSHNGSVSEINLLLTGLLRHVGIQTDPVLLSTRSNGFIHSLYPLISRFNYMVCKVTIDNNIYFLDASEPHLGFGRLPLGCYNGDARVIDPIGTAAILTSDSLHERKFTSFFIINDEKGNWVGSTQQTPGYYESLSLRDRIKEKGADQLQKDIKKDFGTEIAISNFVIDSLDKYENEIGIRYDFDVKSEKEDIIYLNPMFGEGYKENPFKSAQRVYPVEMPFAMDETYNLQMEVPQGYVVDELPKSILVKLNEENEGIFEYRVSQSGDNISFRSRVRIDRANFAPEEYEMLREFFNLVVSKQAEQIVFKKKK